MLTTTTLGSDKGSKWIAEFGKVLCDINRKEHDEINHRAHAVAQFVEMIVDRP